MQQQRHVIINADDFGMSNEVNKGTIEGIKQGVVSSVSVMVNMPYFDEAIAFLKKYPKVSVGLHFNITEGRPLSLPKDTETLISEDNSFYFWPSLVSNIVLKKINLNEVKNELKAQYEKLCKTHIPVTHIDSHHHIHLEPHIFGVVSSFAEQQKVLTLRGNQFNLWNITCGIWQKPIATQTIVNSLLLLSNFRDHDSHLYHANRFYDLNWGKKLTITRLENILENLPSGTTEFICHLAYMSKDGNTSFLKPRQKILQLLTTNKIKRLLKENGIQLVSHSAIEENLTLVKDIAVS